MKLFIDSAEVTSIKKWAKTGIIEGVTTNPSLLAAGGTDPVAVVKQIAQLVPEGIVSVEVTEQEPEAVEKQAHALAELASNIVVKIPCKLIYYPIIKRLVSQGIAINVTLVFTVVQALCMCNMKVAYISPFVGRWNDIDVSGVETVGEIAQMMILHMFDTQLLAASIRDVRDLHGVIQAGADIATVPPEVLEKATRHVLTRDGQRLFMQDWQALGIKKFPL